MARPRLEKPNYRLTKARGRDSWYISWTERGRPKRISTGETDEQAARRSLAEFTVRMANARRADKDDLLSVLDHYLEFKKAKYEERRDVSGYPSLNSALKPIREYFGTCRPSEVNRTLNRDYIEWRRGYGVKDGTIRKELTIFRAALNHGRKEGLFEGDIISFELPPEPPPREYWMTIDQVKQFMAAPASPHVDLFSMLALHTLSRKSAILGLQWNWGVDFETSLVQFNPPGRIQTKKRRVAVPMNGALKAALLDAYRLRTTDYVVEYKGRPIKDLQRGFAEKARKANLEWVTPHVLRHTGASILAQNGAPMHEIAQMMGDDVRTVERHYLKYSPDYLKNASGTLERAYG